MVVTLGQQYNVGEKPTVILYTYNDSIAMQGHKKNSKNKNIQHSSTSSNMVLVVIIYPVLLHRL